MTPLLFSSLSFYVAKCDLHYCINLVKNLIMQVSWVRGFFSFSFFSAEEIKHVTFQSLFMIGKTRDSYLLIIVFVFDDFFSSTVLEQQK